MMKLNHFNDDSLNGFRDIFP